jgi:hypothetical protein
MPTSIRDASLTTLKHRQRALAAWRSTTHFPVNGSARPEQAGSQPQATGDVSLNARLGACLGGCNASASASDPDGYGKQAPALAENFNF